MESSRSTEAFLRGCVDRLLLFGLDDDVRNVYASYNSQRICRQTDRNILRLYPLSDESEVVTFCSCVGDFCNDKDMLSGSNSSDRPTFLLLSILIALFLLKYR
ncbi:unnamed protein product [Caenorhabditis auriculariae]|uniref:Uncharacterized protein n=1 Tax=Caenorhabditis auriculariae TaxID=2777116 RepID=A0A8S1GT01_9PELO|nr:unnamed protein product [Caenorhabditis auriculariae]